MGWLQLWRFAVGDVRFRGDGDGFARFLNGAASCGIRLTDTRREGGCLYGHCRAGQYRTLSRVARQTGVRLRVVRKRGLYFSFYPYRRRKGLAVGAAAGLLLVLGLSRCIWIVQPEGNVLVSDERIVETVAELGVYVGCRIADTDMEELRMRALSALPELVYLSVNPHGCVARVAVKERAAQPQLRNDREPPSDLVAAADGRILSLRVYSGQAAVAVGDGVTAGTLLVNGAVESASGNVRLFRAAGEVTAETARTLTVTVPSEEQQLLPCGAPLYRPSLRFLKWEIPLFCSMSQEGRFAVSVFERLSQRNGIELPIGLIERRYLPLAAATVRFSAEQALLTAQERLAAAVQALEESGVTVKEQTAYTADTENGCTLTVTLRCEEDIAVERPMDIVP